MGVRKVIYGLIEVKKILSNGLLCNVLLKDSFHQDFSSI